MWIPPQSLENTPPRGDKDQAFQWLEKAYAEKARGLESLEVARPWEPYRSDPRYLELLNKMGLSQ